ncbi:MAG: CDP-archaeol synthase [Candidatus Schekmanbacteria bacterium]|nr:MAG: CDP-archaeol synthase [Candidatus Schekmanbacteria bacterium]
MSNSKRYSSALILIAVVILILEKGGITGLYIALLVVSILSLLELREILAKSNLPLPRIPLIVFGLGAFYYLSIVKERNLLFFLFLLAVSIVVLIFRMSVLSQKNTFLAKLFVFMFSILFISLPFACLIAIRKSEGGLAYLYLVFMGTWASDSGAYIVGKQWGKRKMSPQISPNKTYEGLAGGIFLTIVVFIIWHFFSGISLGWAVLLGIIISLSATAGDLMESFLKRQAEVKDSGSLIPGHGGILDRIDALLFTLPIWYICTKFFL